MALNQGTPMDLIPLLAVVSLALTLVHTGLIVLIWQRQEGTREKATSLDTRLHVMEAHLSGIDDIRTRQQQQSEQLAALIERTASTQDMLLSIQEHLRKQST